MSVVFLIVPAVQVGWPFLCAAAAAAAAQLGYSALKGSVEAPRELLEQGVALEIENSQVLTDQIRPDEEMMFAKGGITLHIYKDARGQCALHVTGEGRSAAELKREGTAFVNRIKQQFVYQRVTQELKGRGFSITGETVTEEGRIRIQLRKFE